MKAIKTKYYGPGNVRGSRIIASDMDRNKFIMSYDHGLNSDENHEKAAYLLMTKMGWPNTLVGGGFKDCNVWVMLPYVKARFAKSAGNTIEIDGKEVCHSVLQRTQNGNGPYAVAPWEHDALISRCVELLNIHGFSPKL